MIINDSRFCASNISYNPHVGQKVSTTELSHKCPIQPHAESQRAMAAHSPKANPPIAAARTAARMPVPLTPTLAAEPTFMIGPAATPPSVEPDEVVAVAVTADHNVTGSVELLREVAEKGVVNE